MDVIALCCLSSNLSPHKKITYLIFLYGQAFFVIFIQSVCRFHVLLNLVNYNHFSYLSLTHQYHYQVSRLLVLWFFKHWWLVVIIYKRKISIYESSRKIWCIIKIQLGVGSVVREPVQTAIFRSLARAQPLCPHNSHAAVCKCKR